MVVAIKQVSTHASRVAGTSRAEWIPVRDLVVDESYQREVDQRHVARIAENFNPDYLGAIDVAHRASGQYFVVDGQHRVLAMRQRGMGDWLL